MACGRTRIRCRQGNTGERGRGRFPIATQCELTAFERLQSRLHGKAQKETAAASKTTAKAPADIESKKRAVARMAEQLGVTELVRSRRFKSAGELRWYPKPSVKPDTATAGDRRVPEILQELESVIPNATFDCPTLGPETNAVDYLSFALPILEALQRCGVIGTAENSVTEIGAQLANAAA